VPPPILLTVMVVDSFVPIRISSKLISFSGTTEIIGSLEFNGP